MLSLNRSSGCHRCWVGRGRRRSPDGAGPRRPASWVGGGGDPPTPNELCTRAGMGAEGDPASSVGAGSSSSSAPVQAGPTGPTGAKGATGATGPAGADGCKRSDRRDRASRGDGR